MITAETLRDIAKQAARLGDTRRQRQADLCARWMRQHGLSEVHSIGPFGNSGIQPGDVVRLDRGAPVGGDWSRDVTAKSYLVRVSNVLPGYAGTDPAGTIAVVNERLQWSGRYGWCWTDACHAHLVRRRTPTVNGKAVQADFLAQLAFQSDGHEPPAASPTDRHHATAATTTLQQERTHVPDA